MKVCDECGEEIADNALECTNCGSWQGFQGVETKYIFVFLLGIFLGVSGALSFLLFLAAPHFTQASITIFCAHHTCHVISPVTLGALAYSIFATITSLKIIGSWIVGKKWTREEIQQIMSEEDSDS